MKKIWMAKLAAGLLTLAFALAPQGGSAQELKSLRGDKAIDALDAVPPVANVREKAKLERAYRQQPPLIPHVIEKYEIDLKVNQCLRCHDWPYNVQESAPKISETHYVDREGTRLDKIAGTRWFCTQCHVPQADAKPLVENRFKPASGR